MPKDRKHAWWDEEAYSLDEVEPRTMTIEEEARDDWTGLLGARGEKIMRARQPVGFRVRRG